jgi:carbonic anhydrase
MPSPSLAAIIEKINPALQHVANLSKNDALVEASIQENVRQSAKNVLATSDILRHFVEAGKLTLFQAKYQLDTGLVVRL